MFPGYVFLSLLSRDRKRQIKKTSVAMRDYFEASEIEWLRFMKAAESSFSFF